MQKERIGLIKFRNQDVTVIGEDLSAGDPAPEFTVQSSDWSDHEGLLKTSGKVRIIAALPSLDTEVCDRETRRFNLEAASLGEDIVILVISMDLPYAQKRWCGASGVDKVVVLSDHKSGDFGVKYGCLMKDVRLLRRAIFVVDQGGTVTYAAYMPALGVEPDYPGVLEAAKAALQQGA
jgi:thiol peroxidase